MAYHHYSTEELQDILETLSELNNEGLLSGLGIFVSYAKETDSSKFNYIKVGNFSEVPILKALHEKIERNFKKFSAKQSDDRPIFS